MSGTTSLPERPAIVPPRRADATVPAGREKLLAELDRRSTGPARLDLLVLRDADGLDPLLDADDDVRARVAGALLAAAHRHGASLYRLEASVHALVSAARGTHESPAAAARAMVAEVSDEISATMVHGDAIIPTDALTGEAALRVALERLRTRGRLARRSAERQVRDVLLQLLCECRPDGSPLAGGRVAADAVAVGRRLGMGIAELDVLVRAAELQDLGKLAIPERILRKATPLTDDDWQVIHGHPLAGERILSAAPALEPVARLVRSCSERFDGSGYPDGLTADEIPLGARVIAVCVAFDAMTSTRPYRPALPIRDALGELFRGAGAQFDPMVVAAFCATSARLR